MGGVTMTTHNALSVIPYPRPTHQDGFNPSDATKGALARASYRALRRATVCGC